MIASGQSVVYVAQALGISEALIYNRNGGPLEATDERAAVAREEKHHSWGQASEMLIENQRLLQRINQLETERDSSKKALAIISRQT